MENRNPQVWARVDPEIRERIRVESKRLFDGNESLLVRKAIIRFLDELDIRRAQATADSLSDLVSAA
jgi:hypothetical protein